MTFDWEAASGRDEPGGDVEEESRENHNRFSSLTRGFAMS